jgi:septation ring formation regulator EzrA
MEETAQPSLFTEMKSIEDEYLKHIASEWKTFQLTATDESLVKKYKERLENLDESYQELKQTFLVQKNSLTTLEKMIKNLQMRLTLLQEIQQHLKRLQDEQNNI